MLIYKLRTVDVKHEISPIPIPNFILYERPLHLSHTPYLTHTPSIVHPITLYVVLLLWFTVVK